MLTNGLTLHRRGARRSCTAREVANFEANLNFLHADDGAVVQYFGMNRKQLSAYANESLNDHPLPAHSSRLLHAWQEKITRLDTAPIPAQGPLDITGNFYWIGYRFFLCFVDEFKSDERYVSAMPYINEQATFACLQRYVSHRVIHLCEPSLIHRLNTHIAEGAAVRLAEFNQQLKTLRLTSFFERYPVLASLIFGLLTDTVNYVYAIIFHFAADIEQLAQRFPLSSSIIDAIELGLGDPHARGETVCRVGVGTVSLIYKPRASREALFFNELLADLRNKTGAACFAVYAPVIVSRECHSWIERIDNLPCEGEAGVTLFYKKMGAQIAIIHALNGIDFHYENIIACADSPVMIDLECLFTASVSDLLIDLPEDGALFSAFRLTRQSVFSSGFVPFAQGSGNDRSGLTRQQRFVSSGKSVVFADGFYHLRTVDFEHQPAQKHLPLLAGERKGVESYQAAFFEGFDCAYDALITHRQSVGEALEQAGGQLCTRVLIKNTQRYAQFIGLSRHPRFMQNMLDREVLLATLWNDVKPVYLAKGIPRHEIHDLQRLSIPCFTMPLDSSDLISAHGETVRMGQVATPLKTCLEKLARLSQPDKVLQRTVLKACLFPLSNAAQFLDLKHAPMQTEGPLRTQWVDAIERIAARIESLAITASAADIRWLSFPVHASTQRRYIAPMGHDLYAGLAGIGLFYLGLFKVTANPRHLACADHVMRSLDEHFGFFKNDLGVSVYHGLGSYIYLLINHRLIVGGQQHDEKIESLLDRLMELPVDDYAFDFLGGCCGAVTLLANIHALYPRDELVTTLRRMMKYITQEVIMDEDLVCRRPDQSAILTGLSHGLSGVIVAVCKAYTVTRDAALVPLASRLMEAENRCTHEGFWLDLRNKHSATYLSKWCHGDGGILIARRLLLSAMGETLEAAVRQAAQDDIAKCESNLWRNGTGCGFSLCHGDFGNLIALYDLYRESGNHEGIDWVERAFDQLAQVFFEGAFLDNDQYPDMGLLTGISGVGYALLYRMDPTIPNVLLLDLAVCS